MFHTIPCRLASILSGIGIRYKVVSLKPTMLQTPKMVAIFTMSSERQSPPQLFLFILPFTQPSFSIYGCQALQRTPENQR